MNPQQWMLALQEVSWVKGSARRVRALMRVSFTGSGDMIKQKVTSHEIQPIAFQLFKNPEFHLHSFSGHLAVANHEKDFPHS